MTSIKQAYSYNYSVEFQSEIRLFRLRIAENSFASFLSLSLLVRRLSFYIGAICHFVGCILPISSKSEASAGYEEFSRCKQTQKLPMLLAQQCCELLRPCWQWCANRCNNSQQFWDLQCIVERTQPIRP